MFPRLWSSKSWMNFLTLRLLRIPEPKLILHNLGHSLATDYAILDPHLNSQTLSKTACVDFSQEAAKILATQLANCSTLSELNQIYARMIRTHMLELHSASFYWNNIMRSYTKLEAASMALHVYVAMTRDGIMPDSYTLPIVLKAACRIFDTQLGRQLHCLAIRIGLETNEFCESGIISLYCKVGEFENAYKMFDENCNRKLGSWNAITGGLSQAGRAKEAISMFLELRKSGFKPDDVTIVTVTSACGSLGDLDLAYQLHKCAFQARSLEKSDLLMLNSLIDMYGKCGRMDLAYRVFSRIEQRNVSSWTSMIVGYAMHGHVNEALECFHYMREAGVRPNNVTFVGVLSACVHGGKVQEGKYYFNLMKKEYGIMPHLQHYGCMADLLGRAGLLEEAIEMVEDMPMEPNVIIWGSLMGACEKYGNIKIGEWVCKHLEELEPWNDGAYVVLSNIYASNGLWVEVERMRGIMKEKRLAKVAAYSLPTSSS
ncbi:pentatricopeptide repeat-containing protein At1g77170, mitochondrial [Diospyros lotus]|uniref:pentatricopeptide repeat-containing protein At1g77170, mitochondrial n=1 Tax=Diospyros lotus TaxID=55363 RepID=UPI002252F103|nr:pentatricopeptide repeat-containing protein At1g77170, mitochondrial [Diospyros lotus]XP_052198944.1 pentatricopeptide repeat-containing protein At1g77170, mitochondrial [Diospyros lotus]XP_052198945.1 pentatricopeptide repeat-containing protein At1g77170, mitochondrial [Diospyros lotus]